MTTKYSEEQVKKAFWATFHKVGELFFNHFGNDEENEGATQQEWDYFLKNLQKEQSDE